MKILANPHIDIKISIIANKDVDRRIYNTPSTNEIAILIPGFGECEKPTKREALVFEKTGTVKKMDCNHQAYDPLMYPLIFPSGQLGWAPNTILLTNVNEKEYKKKEDNENATDNDISDEEEDLNTIINQEMVSEEQSTIPKGNENLSNNNEINQNDFIPDFIHENSPDNEEDTSADKVKKMKFVSSMQYYAYLLCDRPGNQLHKFGRLFHQFIVDQFSKIELGRLNFFRHNQDKLRADKYKNIVNAKDDNVGKTTGKRIVLPSTCKG